MTETLKQIRLCTDGSTAPIVNCGPELEMIITCYLSRIVSSVKTLVYLRGLNNNEIYCISHT